MKPPRERLVSLRVEATPCGHVFERVLRAVTARARTPADIAVHQGPRTIEIAIVFDRAVFAPSAAFIVQIEAIPAVKAADVVDCRGRSLFAAVDGEDAPPAALIG